MQVTDVKRQIQSKKLDHFLVFTGNEIEAQRIYINKISEVTDKPVKRIDQVSEAFNKRASLLKISYCFVCRDDMEFWKSATSFEIVQELLGDNILILQMTTIDKRSKSYKSYTSQIVEFNYMPADVVYKYLEKACALSDERAYELISLCENDYSRVLLEADKINRVAVSLQINVNDAYDKLIADKAISRPPKDAIFDFVDAMLRANIDKAFELLEDCKAIGEPALKIISVLYTNFRRVLQYQICEDKDICGTTGLTPFEVKLAKSTAGVWASADILFFLKTFQSIEQGIRTGEIEESMALDYLMVTIL